MLKPTHEQPKMGRQPGLEELSQVGKVLQLRLTGKWSSEMEHHSPMVTHIHLQREKGKGRNCFCSYERESVKTKAYLNIFLQKFRGFHSRGKN